MTWRRFVRLVQVSYLSGGDNVVEVLTGGRD